MCFCKPNIRTPFCPDCPQQMFTRIAELSEKLAAAQKALALSANLIEVVRTPNQEHVADAHNDAVRALRQAAQKEES